MQNCVFGKKGCSMSREEWAESEFCHEFVVEVSQISAARWWDRAKHFIVLFSPTVRRTRNSLILHNCRVYVIRLWTRIFEQNSQPTCQPSDLSHFFGCLAWRCNPPHSNNGRRRSQFAKCCVDNNQPTSSKRQSYMFTVAVVERCTRCQTSNPTLYCIFHCKRHDMAYF